MREAGRVFPGHHTGAKSALADRLLGLARAAASAPVEPVDAEPARGTSGIALVCSDDGAIRRVVWDDVGAGHFIRPGTPFTEVVRPDDRACASAMLSEIAAGAVVSDFDLYLALGSRMVAFKFFACRFGAASLLLVGSTRRSRVVRLFEQLLKTSHQQNATLRALLEDCHRRLQGAMDAHRSLFAEVVRLRREVAELRAERPGDGRERRSRRQERPAGARAPESALDC
ncbi:MAG TPA: hypothetical protein VFD92_26545 [Candidatus Binatia bacterium]|nr:hypothetical protein [Candidatus Binatia bacterium]